MKQRFCLTLLLAISTLFFGCGKPEPPAEESQPVKAKPKRNYTLDNKTTPPKQDLVANVTVIDDETGIAIEGASVRGRVDSANQEVKFVEGIEIGDGKYYLPIEELKGSFYVGASAKDYPGNASYKPAFPYEIKLTSGETVTVSGEIIDEFHQPVTKGVMNLRVDKDWGKNWPKFYLSSVEINQHGKFKLENIPANMKDVYAKYECLGEPAFDFKDQLFEIENEDIYLKLKIPPKLIVRGRVTYSSGEAVSGAWVWVEKVMGEELDPWNKLIGDKSQALDKVSFCTQTDGEFELRINDDKDKYSIKAYKKSYLPAYQGPYTAADPPLEMVELIIKNDGARLVGKIIDNNGVAVTNCTASYGIEKPPSAGYMMITSQDLLLDIDENGEYISGLVPLGISEVYFDAKGYYGEHKKINIIEEKAYFLDVKFYSKSSLITGTVYDAVSRLPLSGVTVTTGWKKDAEAKITDENGQFYFKLSESNFKFAYPGYGLAPYFLCRYMIPPKYDSSLNFQKLANPKFYLSPSCTVRLVVNNEQGQPLNGNKVRIRQQCGNTSSRALENLKFLDGEILLTNLFSNANLVDISIRDLKNKKNLIEIKKIRLVPGEEVVVYTNLPASGGLILEFKKPFEKDKISIILSTSDPLGIIFVKYQFAHQEQSFQLNDIPTNIYRLDVGSNLDRKGFLSTNICISANNTTKIMIENNEDELGVIKGSVKTISGKNVPFHIWVKSQGESSVTAMAPKSYDNSFIIVNLPKKYQYKLGFQTNGTNIYIKDLKPDGAPVDIILPDVFVLTGNIVDCEGKPLNVEVGLTSASQSVKGEFKLYPVFNGSYKMVIKSQEYVDQYQDVIVNDNNLDLGNIVLTDKGLKISGRLVDDDNNPITNCRIIVRWKLTGYKRIKTSENGGFSFLGIPAGANLKIQKSNTEIDLGVVSADLDLGDIKLSEFEPTK